MTSKRGPAPKPAVRETADAVVVTAGDLKVGFSSKTGLLDSVERGSQKYSLTGGPRPAVGKFEFRGIRTEVVDNGLSVTVDYDGDLEGVEWFIFNDGWAKCDYRYRATGPQEFHGVVFDYPEKLVRGKRWLGDGPWRVWKNRQRGNTLGVWQNEYNDTITGYSGWKYPEFKGCLANVYWLQLETDEGPITVVPGRPHDFVQVLTPSMPSDDLIANTKVSLPKAGLAFLQAIPPVGSKFKHASTSGPQGQLDVAEGEYSGSVSFYFGKLP